MHPEVGDWLRDAAKIIGNNGLRNAQVVEVGSLDVNGAARDHFPKKMVRRWLGIDLIEGPGVDRVGDALDELMFTPLESFDMAVSTEVFEHAQRWRLILREMCNVLKPEGWLIVTCAGTGRPEHAADGSPNGPHPGEYYRNVSLSELTGELPWNMMDVVVAEEGPPGDTRLIARKKPTPIAEKGRARAPKPKRTRR